jgi:pimeloyl-ACP methyl ester carboxylesterase
LAAAIIPSSLKTSYRQQTQAIFEFNGICDAIPRISQPTLIVTGTDDILIPAANSMILTEKSLELG